MVRMMNSRSLEFSSDSGGWQTLQIGTGLHMIGHELQGVTEILTGLGDPARLGFEHAQVVPVVGVVWTQTECCFSFIYRLFQLPGAGQSLSQERGQIRTFR